MEERYCCNCGDEIAEDEATAYYDLCNECHGEKDPIEFQDFLNGGKDS